METSLPNEILMKLFKLLSPRDSLNLASTCSRFFDFLPSVMRSFDLEELILGNGRVAPSIDFLMRNGLSSRIKKVRVDIANGDEKLAAYLKNLFDSCPNIQALVLESANLDPDLSFLTDFLSAISVRELHCEKNISEVAVSFPQNVEKCSISLYTLAQMYGCHVSEQTEDGSSFLRSVKSLRLWFPHSPLRATEFPHSIWRMLSGIPCLEELTLEEFALNAFNCDPSPYLHISDIASNWQPHSRLKKLTLETIISESGLNVLLQRCPFVEIIHFNLIIMSEWERNHVQISWPMSLKKFHICGKLIFGVNALLQSVRFLPNLETITHDFSISFRGMFDVQDCYVPNNCIQIIPKLNAGVLKDWFITIRKPADWAKLISLLRLVSRLEHLYLYIWLYNKYDVGQIEKAYPMITTEIVHLTVNDNHFEHTTSFNVLTSFANVGNYSINCEGESQFFQVCQDWPEDQRVSPSSAWNLDLFWSGSNKYDQLRNFSKVTHLILKTGSKDGSADSRDVQIDLEKIRDAVGANLRFLQVMDDGIHRVPIIDPLKIGTCLHFTKLQHFAVEDLDDCHFEAFSQSLDSLKPFQSWPSHLKLIWLLFGDKYDKYDSRTIVVENCSLGVSVRVSCRPHGVMKWDSPWYLNGGLENTVALR